MNMKSKLLFLAGIIILISIITGIIFAYLLKPISDKESVKQIEFKIEQGMGAGEISRNLFSSGLIKSEIAFKIFSFLGSKASIFKPGIYNLSSSQSTIEIVDELVSGPQAISATIIPGMTLKEIDNYLAELNILSNGDLVKYDINSAKSKYTFLEKAKSLEGFLLPDTYMFIAGSDSASVVDKILDNFQDKVFKLLKFENNGDVYKKIIIASILEKEVIKYKDKQIVAGIFEKRLINEIPLQVDATVIYAKCAMFSECNITRDDYKINSPYNTYKYKGYPPAPISNPGIESIIAAVNPIKTDYLYYLSDPKTQKTIFSKTFDEHDSNRAKYLR